MTANNDLSYRISRVEEIAVKCVERLETARWRASLVSGRIVLSRGTGEVLDTDDWTRLVLELAGAELGRLSVSERVAGYRAFAQTAGRNWGYIVVG